MARAWRPSSPVCTATSHTVTLTTHGRSLTRASLTQTTLLTPAGALTRGVSFTQGGSHTRAASRAHMVSSPCGAPFTHGVPGSTHSGTLVTTPLAHGGSSVLGGALGVSFGAALTLVAPRTQRLSLALCVRRSTHLATLVYMHRDTTHTGTTLAGTTLFTTHTGTFTPGILATTRAPGVSIPPKLRVHPSAALLPSTSRGTTEFTWP